MKLSIICFSLTGRAAGERLAKKLRETGMEVSLVSKSKYISDSLKESVSEWTKKQFFEADGILFIGACGIAVRSIAPYVASKKSDPAVLVMDECGKFVISLLSGHLGGANELAETVAELSGAVPVVTTATDLHRQFAVDVFAKKNGCAVFYMKAAKEVSAAVLAGEPVGFYSEFPYDGKLPEGLVVCGRNGLPKEKEKNGTERLLTGVSVTIRKDCLPFASTVHVIPKAVVMGLGCRKGKEAEEIRRMAEKCLEESGIYREAVCLLSSIDLKKEEPGIRALGEAWELPFVTWTEKELQKVSGTFTESSFVKQVTGVDNICERSAVLGACGGKIIRKKTAESGVTTALAVKDWRIAF